MSTVSERPLRILQVFNRYLQPGGEAKSVARIADDLESHGHRVTRFWRHSTEWQGAGAPPRWKQPFLLRRNPAVLAELEAAHARAQAELWLLHNVVPVVSLGVYGLGRRLGVPLVQWLHNYRPISPSGTLLAGRRRLEPEDRRIAWKEAWAGTWHGRLMTAWLALTYAQMRRRGDFEAVGAWVAISKEMKAVFARAGWFPERLHALRHCWHLASAPVGQRDEGYFLFLRRLVESKGIRFLADLWQRPALREHRLVIAGAGELGDELRGRTSANVRWAGHVEGEAKEQLLANCRAVVLPHLWEEPLGLVVYEAYQAGKPVLASALGGVREIVQDGITGALLPPGNPAAWEDALRQWDAAKSRQCGLAGRLWLERNASPEAWHEQFREIVRSLRKGV